MHTCGFMREVKMLSEVEPPALLNGEDADSLEEDEEEEESWKSEPCRCLFCESEQDSALATLKHCRTDHGVDLVSTAAKLGAFTRSTVLCG